jgi:hypothetical protein
MTMIVEDGSGVTGANSYCSLETAAAVNAKLGNTVWATLTSTVQSNYLIQATAALDRIYGTDYLSTAKFTDSPLLFPRFQFMDNNFRLVDSGTIPLCLQEAVAVYAFMIQQGTVDQYPVFNNQNLIRDESMSVGTIKTNNSYFARTKQEKYTGMFPVELTLKPITYQPTAAVRMSR